MTMLVVMAVIFSVLAFALLATTALWGFRRISGDWPLAVLILFLGAVLMDYLVLRSEGLWFWVGIFWNGSAGDQNWFDDGGFQELRKGTT